MKLFICGSLKNSFEKCRRSCVRNNISLYVIENIIEKMKDQMTIILAEIVAAQIPFFMHIYMQRLFICENLKKMFRKLQELRQQDCVYRQTDGQTTRCLGGIKSNNFLLPKKQKKFYLFTREQGREQQIKFNNFI